MQTEAQKKAQIKYRSTDKGKQSRRIRDQRRNEKLRARRLRLLQVFGNRCFICGRTLSPHYLAFHHVKHNYIMPKNDGRYYQEKLLDEVEKHPEDFRVLCVGTCHPIVSLLRKQPELLAKLLECINLDLCSSLLEPLQKV